MPILRPLAAPIRPILGFWESKVPQNGRFPATPMNLPAKFDAASFFVAGKIRNRIYKHKKNKQTNKQKNKQKSKRYIHNLPIGADNKYTTD